VTDYSKMSDFEINCAVARFMGEKFTIPTPENPNNWMILSGNTLTELNFDGSVCAVIVKDYCNSWADAGPIIVANKIDLIQDNGQGCALATTSAIQMFQGDDVHIEQDENPLRAAMIVFLMMNEGE